MELLEFCDDDDDEEEEEEEEEEEDVVEAPITPSMSLEMSLRSASPLSISLPCSPARYVIKTSTRSRNVRASSREYTGSFSPHLRLFGRGISSIAPV